MPATDHRAAPALDYPWQSIFHPEPHAAQIDRYYAVERFFTELRNEAGLAFDARVVVEHVESAECANGLFDHRACIFGVGHVGPQGNRFTAGRLDHSRSLGSRGFGYIDRRDLGAFAREQQRGSAPHSRAGAGDQRNFSLKSHWCLQQFVCRGD
jgi:hypothetical protein